MIEEVPRNKMYLESISCEEIELHAVSKSMDSDLTKQYNQVDSFLSASIKIIFEMLCS